MGLDQADLQRVLNLEGDDLEFQARVLLRKRFEAVRKFVPKTCAKLPEHGWPEFLRYTNAIERTGDTSLAHDARGFCSYIVNTTPAAVCADELNRMNFVLGCARAAIHVVRPLSVRGKLRPGLQLFIRRSNNRAHEWRLSVGF